MSQLLHFSGCEVTIRDLYRVVIEERHVGATSARARGIVNDDGGSCTNTRCDRQPGNRRATSEPPRGGRYFPGTLSQLPLGGISLADRSGCELAGAPAILHSAGTQGRCGHGLVLGPTDLFRKD